MEIDIQIERWPLERLRPRPTNPRTHSPQQLAQLAASIQEFGWTNPILIGTDGFSPPAPGLFCHDVLKVPFVLVHNLV